MSKALAKLDGSSFGACRKKNIHCAALAQDDHPFFVASNNSNKICICLTSIINLDMCCKVTKGEVMKGITSEHRTIDDYILSFSKDVQKQLRALRAAISEQAPEAEEKISYQMPTFYLNGNLVHFAAHKNHIGFYPTPGAIIYFKKQLMKYKTSKGAVQFPIEESLPITLIKQIVRYRVAEAELKSRKKKR